MEILPRQQRPRTSVEMLKLVISGTWLRNEETGQIFHLSKLPNTFGMPTFCLCIKLPNGSITMADILAFPSYDGLHIIEPDYSKGQVSILIPHAVKHQWVPFAQLDIITKL